MEENLVIVESPAKAKTIEKFLGKDFLVKSSYGHIRDLTKKGFGVDIENNFKPQYEIPSDKKQVVSELKKLSKKAKTIWLASDEDREGEAISWHLAQVLKLSNESTKRIVFHEITKQAIQNAIKNPRSIKDDLVHAQQARRILDRIVGFEISPILWKKVKPQLSAGRVQSVSVRLLVEREREIINFKSTSTYRVNAIFQVNDKSGKPTNIKAELSKRFKTKKETLEFLEKCKNAEFKIAGIETKPTKRTPAAPFITSTLQQEASRKLGFSVSRTMSVAQRLYESGKITYMRTDSVNLSNTAIQGAKNEILEEYGDKYLKIRKYRTKSKGAQEAHEAIRPTFLQNRTINGTQQEKRLYELIWKRTIASQMSDAQIEKTTVTIDISTTKPEKFIAKGEVIKFDGFLKVYVESSDDEKDDKPKDILPPLNINDILKNLSISATERFSHHPPRYTEASLVKKLEELGIGRPSTYAPTISTIQKRGYVVRENREGVERKYNYIELKNNKIAEKKRKEITGAEKSKLFPTDLGMVVTDFLIEYFPNIMSYDFTAKVEEQFDEIATGNIIWNEMIDKFYKQFHPKVEHTIKNSQYKTGQRELGKDPKTGLPVYVRIGRYGPMAQIGDKSEDEDAPSPKYASLRKGQHIETITLEEALDLFKLPRKLGKYEDKEIVAGIGRFGPYIRHNNKFVSLKKGEDEPETVTRDRAIELINQKREAEKKKMINEFKDEKGNEMKVLNGRWGPYINYKKKNYKIPKKTDPKELSYDDCIEIINNSPKTKKTSSGKTKKSTKKRKSTKSKTTKSKSTKSKKNK